MKKVIVAILAAGLLGALICLNATAASVNVSKSFTLSKKDETASGYSYSYTAGNGTINSYVQHWKGSFFHADTALTQVKSSRNLTSQKCRVYIYVGSNMNTWNEGTTLAQTATNLWATVSKTEHYIDTTSSDRTTAQYIATGNQ